MSTILKDMFLPTPAEATATAHQMSSVQKYARLAVAGALCCGITHSAVVPVDVVKTRIQLDPVKYNRGMLDSFRKIISQEGAMALSSGLGATWWGYNFQGALKFGGYEFWKATMVGQIGMENASEHRTMIYLLSSGIAEFFADIALCPLEAARIRKVSQPDYASGLPGTASRLFREEGLVKGFYSGFGPMIFKQVPYTMAKFVVFERLSEAIFSTMTPQRKESLSPVERSAVNLSSGLGAGLVAAFVSQPADTLLSKINKTKGAGGEGSIVTRLARLAVELGPRNLFLGMGTRFVMVGTLTAGQFAIYDGIKRMLGVPKTVEIPKPGEKAAAGH